MKKPPRELRSFMLRARRSVERELRLADPEHDRWPSPFLVIEGDARTAIAQERVLPIEPEGSRWMADLLDTARRRPAFVAGSTVFAGGGEALREVAVERIVADGLPPTLGEMYESGRALPVVALVAVDRGGAAIIRCAMMRDLVRGLGGWGAGEIMGSPWILDVQQAMAGRAEVPPLDTGMAR